ncbi:MFS transporter [Altererythrobacter sp. GH1-8]|uniref:MFS transporter n=1 Tax=Altererythrobacter sp. GH1-8 TaxID=3349333 RepID=UPI00374D2506
MSPEEKPYPSPKVAWYAVSVLLIAYTIAFIDRTILSLLVGPIQADLGIGDTAMGLLHGIAFALFYCFLGLPIAWLSDRFSRRWIIAIGMILWSAMTALCGLAKNFTQLFLARMGVGVGEAALSPAAYSMIADLFPPSSLGRAMGVYSSGVFFGAGVAFLVGGFVISLATGGGALWLPLFGELRVWQFVFVIVGLPGVLFALLMLTVPEPERRAKNSGGAKASSSGLITFLRENPKASIGHFLGFALLGVVFNGFVAWGPTQMIRDFGVTASDAGAAFGIGIFICGGGGIILGGLVADKLTQRGYEDAAMRAGIIGGIGLIPTGLAAPLMPDFISSAIAYAAFFLFASFPFGAAAAALQLMTPPGLRAQMSAMYLLVLNLIGIGGGPLLIAAISDYVLSGPASIGTGMAVTAAITTPLGVLTLIATLPAYRLLRARS